eukprot:SAG11_NODE_11005_length_790_cov_1.004342_2_plen_21_part_01
MLRAADLLCADSAENARGAEN